MTTNNSESLAQAHKLQRDFAADGIVLVALTKTTALALMDAVNFTAARVADNDLHIGDAQNGAAEICGVMERIGLL